MCNAGVANYNGAAVIAPTVTSESQNVYRSHGNLQQVSYNSKTIDTPYSSVSKHDVRVSNPGIAVAHQPAIAYHSAPAVHGMIPLYLLAFSIFFRLEIEKGKFLWFQLLPFISRAIMHPPPQHTTRIIPLQQVMFALLFYCYYFISLSPSPLLCSQSLLLHQLLPPYWASSTHHRHLCLTCPIPLHWSLMVSIANIVFNIPSLTSHSPTLSLVKWYVLQTIIIVMAFISGFQETIKAGMRINSFNQ